MAFDTSYDIIYRPVLGGHPVLSGHYSFPRGCPLNTGSTVILMRQVQTNKASQSLEILQMPVNFCDCIRSSYIFASFQQIVHGEATVCRVLFSSRVDRFLLTYTFQKLSNCGRIFTRPPFIIFYASVNSSWEDFSLPTPSPQIQDTWLQVKLILRSGPSCSKHG